MLLWFAGGAMAIVWSVFRDPAMDYRLVMAGALLPDLVDAPFGGVGLAHTLAASAALLAVVMVATRGRRRLRRRLLALPIGSLLHLVLDGAWTTPDLFWWPALSGLPSGELPSAGRPVWVIALMEAAGAAALAWTWRQVGSAREART